MFNIIVNKEFSVDSKKAVDEIQAVFLKNNIPLIDCYYNEKYNGVMISDITSGYKRKLSKNEFIALFLNSSLT